MRKLLSEIIAAAAMISLSNSIQADTELFPALSKTKNSDTAEGMLLRYSKLPPEVLLKAWTDPKYQRYLLNNPNSVLHDYWRDSIEIEFFVHPNTEKVKHLCLPYPRENLNLLAPEEVLAQLERDRGQTNTLHYFLPPTVVAKAFLDEEFKNVLLKNPSLTLKNMGYPLTQNTCIVHENTESTRHLILDAAPNDAKELSKVERRVVRQSNSCAGCHPAQSGGCCASGTCN